MGHSTVPGVPDRTRAVVHSDVGSVVRVLLDRAPAGMQEHGSPKADPGTSPAPIQVGWQWNMRKDGVQGHPR